MKLKCTLGLALASLSTFAVAEAPSKNAPPTPQSALAEFALRDQCQALANQLLQGFKAARQGRAAPSDEAGLAGFQLPANTDIASQAQRIRRACLKESVGTTDENWAAVEVMSQSRLLRMSAFRCLLSGMSFTEDVTEAEMEFAGCHKPEYPGLPASQGGGEWTIRQTDTLTGPALELKGQLTGNTSGITCTRINEFHKTADDPTCQVRDSYSVVTSTFALEPAKDQSDAINDMMRKLVEDYKRQHPSEGGDSPKE